MAVAGRRPQLAPRRLLELLLERNGLLDLMELDVDQLIVLVALRVVFVHDLLGLLELTLGNQPARRLGHEPDKHDLEQRRDRLQQARRAPRPVAGDVVGAKRHPGADERAQVPQRVVDGGIDGAVLRVHELGDEQRRRAVRDGDAEAEQQAAHDEERNVHAQREQHDADDHDGAADDDAGAPPEEVRAVRHKGDGEHAADGEGGGDEAEDGGAGVVEVVPPLRHALQTVDEGAVVS